MGGLEGVSRTVGKDVAPTWDALLLAVTVGAEAVLLSLFVAELRRSGRGKREMKAILAALRTSEFWAFLAVVIVEIANAPVPAGAKWGAYVYIVFRGVSKVVQYVFPNPSSPNAGWMKNDSQG